jgi:hypothetical protein
MTDDEEFCFDMRCTKLFKGPNCLGRRHCEANEMLMWLPEGSIFMLDANDNAHFVSVLPGRKH